MTFQIENIHIFKAVSFIGTASRLSPDVSISNKYKIGRVNSLLHTISQKTYKSIGIHFHSKTKGGKLHKLKSCYCTNETEI